MDDDPVRDWIEERAEILQGDGFSRKKAMELATEMWRRLVERYECRDGTLQ